MTAAASAPDDPEAGLVAAIELLERARRAVARGEPPDLERLARLLEGLPARFGPCSGADHRRRRRVMALLDEAGTLTEALRAEQAQLAIQLRAAGVHRRARAAYRRASKL
jgi:hypothetical protein